jgi:hypothetical protein
VGCNGTWRCGERAPSAGVQGTQNDIESTCARGATHTGKRSAPPGRAMSAYDGQEHASARAAVEITERS